MFAPVDLDFATLFTVFAAQPTMTDTQWDHQYHTLRRQHLFQNPPSDRTAYPALQLAVDPHIESFNAIFRGNSEENSRNPGLIAHGIADIGSKVYLDADQNRLTIRYKSVTLQRSLVPVLNKFAKKREILPSECRERHSSYRGRLTAILEYQINDGDREEVVRDFGLLPIMVKVCCPTSKR